MAASPLADTAKIATQTQLPGSKDCAINRDRCVWESDSPPLITAQARPWGRFEPANRSALMQCLPSLADVRCTAWFLNARADRYFAVNILNSAKAVSYKPTLDEAARILAVKRHACYAAVVQNPALAVKVPSRGRDGWRFCIVDMDGLAAVVAARPIGNRSPKKVDPRSRPTEPRTRDPVVDHAHG